MLRLGFGFAEIGTVTPLPQPGNPTPRMFRLPPTRRWSTGWASTTKGTRRRCARLRAAHRARRHRRRQHRRQQGQRRSRRRLCGGRPRASRMSQSYFTVNISSPNTPGLRGMQQRQALDELLARVMAARDETALGGRRSRCCSSSRPISLEAELDDIARRGFGERGRRRHRLQHDDRPAGLAARQRGWRRSGRPVGPAAVRALDAHAGRGLPAGRRAACR